MCRPVASGADAHTEGVGGVKDQCGFGIDVCSAGNVRDDLIVIPLAPGLEDAADNALLAPGFAGINDAICHQAG